MNVSNRIGLNCNAESTLDLHHLLYAYKKEYVRIGLAGLCRLLLRVRVDSRNYSRDLENAENDFANVKNDAHIAMELFKALVNKIEKVKESSECIEVNLEKFIKKHCLKYLNSKY